MICSVGLTCVDIVNFMSKYPPEDSDLRCGEQSWERGGNAANSATVLGLLGAEVEYVGNLANDKLLGFLIEDMESVGIKHENCKIIDDCKAGPISIVLCSRERGSRTIVHSKGNLPELSFENFRKLNFDKYSWMHFEGRNENELPKMMQLVREYNQLNGFHTNELPTSHEYIKYKCTKLPVSLEVELHIENLDLMLPLADVVIVGKDFATHHGAQNSVQAAQIVAAKVDPGTVLICPWGEQGASYCVVSLKGEDFQIKTQTAYQPVEIVDSLGAGDTFNAIIIYCLNNGLDLGESVNYACLVASKKLQMRGLKGLKKELPHLVPALHLKHAK